MYIHRSHLIDIARHICEASLYLVFKIIFMLKVVPYSKNFTNKDQISSIIKFKNGIIGSFAQQKLDCTYFEIEVLCKEVKQN